MIGTNSLQALTRRIRERGNALTQRTGHDRALARRLYTTFERDLEVADVHGLHFYVSNGTVTLYGTIRSELDRDLLISVVRQVPGVKGVVTRLQFVDRRFQHIADVDTDV